MGEPRWRTMACECKGSQFGHLAEDPAPNGRCCLVSTDPEDAERIKRERFNATFKLADPINPSHYKSGAIECIDAIEVATEDLTGIEAMCIGNAMKYLWRWKQKNGIEDLRKAQWYINRVIERGSK